MLTKKDQTRATKYMRSVGEVYGHYEHKSADLEGPGRNRAKKAPKKSKYEESITVKIIRNKDSRDYDVVKLES